MATSSSRSVHANRITSTKLPTAQISVNPTFTYIGGPQFQLYGIAHAEQHLFVIASEQQDIQRLVWVQFEGFLPDNQRSYHYPVTQTVELGGYPFLYDTSSVDIEREVAQRPDSDLAAAQAFLQARGYHRMAGEVHAQRFVHLIGTDKRNELMIIYGESSGEAGKAPITSALERALASFTVQFL
jgi:hypothetical protein